MGYIIRSGYRLEEPIPLHLDLLLKTRGSSCVVRSAHSLGLAFRSHQRLRQHCISI